MHIAWERMALVYALGLPILAIFSFIALMVFEGDYTFFTREIYFSP
jgi:cytochrome c oxidase subunit IV